MHSLNHKGIKEKNVLWLFASEFIDTGSKILLISQWHLYLRVSACAIPNLASQFTKKKFFKKINKIGQVVS
jgi:hypothetical protein